MKGDLFDHAEWVEGILSFSNTGLWSITVDKSTGRSEMVGSKTMLDLLGLPEQPSGKACYDHWWSRIDEEYREYVQAGVEKICSTGSLVEVRYKWNHPSLGKIFVRCAGKVEKEQDGLLELRGYHQNITELETLKREKLLSMEELKRTSKEKERYNELMQSVICGIAQYYILPGKRMKFKQANHEAIRIFGYTEEEFWQKEIWEPEKIRHPDDKKIVGKEIAALEKVGDKVSYEYRILQKNGDSCWIFGNAELVQDIDGEIVVQSVFMDVNQQKKLEYQNQKLSQESQTWKKLLRECLRNTGIYEIYYYPKEKLQLIPKEMSKKYQLNTIYNNMPYSIAEEIIEKSSQPAFLAMYDEIQNGAKSASCDFAAMGNKIWFHETLSVIEYDEEGKPSLAVGIIEDISEKRMVEMENVNLQAVYDFTVNHNYECVCIVNLETNQYSLRYTGDEVHYGISSAGEVTESLGQELRESFGETAEQFLLENILKCLKEDNSQHTIYYVSKSNRHKETRYSWFGPGQKMILVLIRDIEDMWRQEEEGKRKLEEALKRAENASEAKSQFLSRMSHDIRTPLNAVIGMANIAKKNSYDTKRVEECLEQIEASSQYLYLLINDILDMSKIENGKMELYEERFAIMDFIKNMLAVIKPLASQKRHRLTVIHGNLLHQEVEGDYLRLQQLLINILNNAIKYTNPGGLIELEITELETEKTGFGCYRFQIKDNGIGIDEEFLPHIFEPFERKDSKRVGKVEGSGLGMSIAKTIATMMEGDISVESRPGKGSTFTVTVFLKLCKSGGKEASKETGKDIPDFSGKNILLVEDNIVNRQIAIEILASTDAVLDTAENGKEAVRKVEESEEGYYSMIFMDIRMPIMDGYEASQKIRELNRNDAKTVPIIAMTADAFVEDVKKAKAYGMTEHIAKPININKLYGIMKQWQ